MAIRPESLPQRAFRKNVKPPTLQNWKPTKAQRKANLGDAAARRALLLDLVPDIVEKGRSFQINMANQGFLFHRRRGEFQAEDEIAVVTDGSLNKKPESVRFGGNITILENPANLRLVAEATRFVYDHALRTSLRYKESTPPHTHSELWRVRVDGQVINPASIMSYAERDGWEEMEVTNIAPYAAKLEAKYQRRTDLLMGAWKKARQRGWHARVDMHFLMFGQEYDSDYRRPSILIGRLGTMNGSKRRRVK